MIFWAAKGLGSPDVPILPLRIQAVILVSTGWLHAAPDIVLGGCPTILAVKIFWGLTKSSHSPAGFLGLSLHQASASLCNPFNPGISTATEAHFDQGLHKVPSLRESP